MPGRGRPFQAGNNANPRGRRGVAVIRGARQRLDVGDELPALSGQSQTEGSAPLRGCNGFLRFLRVRSHGWSGGLIDFDRQNMFNSNCRSLNTASSRQRAS